MLTKGRKVALEGRNRYAGVQDVNSMVRRRIGQLIPCAVALWAATAASAQAPASPAPAYRHRLLGVYDIATGEPIEGAQVTDLKSGTMALTTKTGTVSLIFLPDGGTLVRVRKLGYEPGGQFVSISPADTVPVTILLTSSATRLPGMVTTDSSPHYVSGMLRGFEERRKSERGHFVAEAELRRNDARKMQDIVRNFPGLQIVCTRRGVYTCDAVATRTNSRLGGQCKYTLYIDGMFLSDTDLNKLTVADYAGIEAYDVARIPPAFNRIGNSCGVLLLWTREG